MPRGLPNAPPDGPIEFLPSPPSHRSRKTGPNDTNASGSTQICTFYYFLADPSAESETRPLLQCTTCKENLHLGPPSVPTSDARTKKSFLSTISVGYAHVRCEFGATVGLRNCEMCRSQISQPCKIYSMGSSGLHMVVIFTKIFATCFANYGRPDSHVAVNNSIRCSTLCWNVRSEAPYSWTPLVRRKLPPRSRRHLGDGSTFEVTINSRTRCV